MEGSDVAQGVTLDRDVVQQRLSVLSAMLDRLDELAPLVDDVAGRQGRALWTDIPAAASFAAAYRGKLFDLRNLVMDLRREVAHLARALRVSAAQLVETDAATQDLLTAIEARLDGAPTGPAAPSAPTSPSSPTSPVDPAGPPTAYGA